jgi:hypothetical protein
LIASGTNLDDLDDFGPACARRPSAASCAYVEAGIGQADVYALAEGSG